MHAPSADLPHPSVLPFTAKATRGTSVHRRHLRPYAKLTNSSAGLQSPCCHQLPTICYLAFFLLTPNSSSIISLRSAPVVMPPRLWVRYDMGALRLPRYHDSDRYPETARASDVWVSWFHRCCSRAAENEPKTHARLQNVAELCIQPDQPVHRCVSDGRVIED